MACGLTHMILATQASRPTSLAMMGCLACQDSACLRARVLERTILHLGEEEGRRKLTFSKLAQVMEGCLSQLRVIKSPLSTSGITLITTSQCSQITASAIRTDTLEVHSSRLSQPPQI